MFVTYPEFGNIKKIGLGRKMAFCSRCGSRLADGAKFCTNCGAKIIINAVDNQRKQVFEGVIHKCPNCGEIIKAFTTVCPSCGHEFRGTAPSETVKELQLKLEAIEASRKEPKKRIIPIVTLDMLEIPAVDKQKINLIRNFAIPNSKEELVEFIILASSNIETSIMYGNTGYYPGEQAAGREITSAWEAKLNQAYEKARLSFGQDPDFADIQTMYSDKKRAIQHRNTRIKLSIYIALPALILGLIIMFNMLSKSLQSSIEKRRATEESLNAVVEEVMEDVSQGDYDSALMKANGLRYDPALSTERAAQWDEQREVLIKQINDKKVKEENNGTTK